MISHVEVVQQQFKELDLSLPSQHGRCAGYANITN